MAQAYQSADGMLPVGTVLAVEVRDEDGTQGYTSGAAKEIAKRLRPHNIYARPLGDVVYLMCTPTTAKAKCDSLLHSLMRCI